MEHKKRGPMAEARLNREYALRMAGVGAMMFGMCVWSLYDGMAAWPRVNREMEAVRPALLATNLTADAWLAAGDSGRALIHEAFAAQGLKAPSKLIRKLGELKVPERAEDRVTLQVAQAPRVAKLFEGPVYSAHDLQTQFVQAAVTAALGLLAFAAVGAKARRRYVADERGLSGSGAGPSPVAYDEIERIDWGRWDEKGIAVLTLKGGVRLKLDGWHFAGMTGIVEEIRRHRPDLATKNL